SHTDHLRTRAAPFPFRYPPSPPPLSLPSFPTRRSSDLQGSLQYGNIVPCKGAAIPGLSAEFFSNTTLSGPPAATRIDTSVNFERSEEHTSELQSRGHLVCRLLLEKKK